MPTLLLLVNWRRALRRSGVAIAALLLSTSVLAWQVPRGSAGTAELAGQVIEASSPSGVADATVTLTGIVVSATGDAPSAATRTTQTVTSGQFRFDGLAAGRYTLTASKAGYLDGALGRSQPGLMPGSIDLAAGEHGSAAPILMWRLASLGGTIQSESGAPLAGNPIQLLQRGYMGGHLRWGPTPSTTFADAAGRFSFSSLLPGDYLVLAPSTRTTLPTATYDSLLARDPAARARALFLDAGPDPSTWFQNARIERRDGLVIVARQASFPPAVNGRARIYPPAFFPSADRIGDAQGITLDTGDARADVDLRATAVDAHQVAGAVVGPGGTVTGALVRAVSSNLDEIGSTSGMETSVALTDDVGRFTLTGVPDGEYSLEVLARASTDAASGVLFGSLPAAVHGEDLNGLQIPLALGPTVTGRVVFDGSTPAPSPSVLKFRVDPADGRTVGPRQSVATATADGVFAFPGLVPGRYLIRLANQEPPGWSVRSAAGRGVDMLDTPIDLRPTDALDLTVRLIDRPAAIAGVVRDDRGREDLSAAVIVFSTDARYWVDFGSLARRMRMARTAALGQFVVAGLPPDEYFVAAIPNAATNSFRDLPDMLDTLKRVAIRVRVAEHERATVSLTTTTR